MGMFLQSCCFNKRSLIDFEASFDKTLASFFYASDGASAMVLFFF